MVELIGDKIAIFSGGHNFYPKHLHSDDGDIRFSHRLTCAIPCPRRSFLSLVGMGVFVSFNGFLDNVFYGFASYASCF